MTVSQLQDAAQNLTHREQLHLIQLLAAEALGNYQPDESGISYWPIQPSVRKLREPQVPYETRQPRTFSDYFKLPNPPTEIAEMLGYQYLRRRLDFVGLAVDQVALEQQRLEYLLGRIEENLRRIDMHSAIARREFLIAPLVSEVVHCTDARLYVEYPLKASESLQGDLDYYFQAERQILIIEAKNGDLQRGFHQLMAELAALDQTILKEKTHYLYGAVSTGDAWQFGLLDRRQQLILQDIDLYAIPSHIEQVIRLLVAILNDTTEETA